ncbi:MAG: zf-HC2 domain-containing protein [Thermoanaerobaculia bacterium]
MEMYEPFHLDFELLARYADRTADAVDREIVETHAEDCVQCRGELDDLVTYARKSPRRASPFAAAAALLLALAGGAAFFATRDSAPPPREVHIPKLAAELASSARLLRGAPHGLQDIEPLSPAGAMILTDRPRFEWAGPAHAKYRIEIFDEQFHPVVASPLLTSSSWTPPQGLKGGMTYVWQITALVDGDIITVPAPPAPEARFHVIDRAQARAIETLEQSETRPSVNLGIAYAEAGALAEAQRELSALVAANRNAETARRLLHTVQLQTP